MARDRATTILDIPAISWPSRERNDGIQGVIRETQPSGHSSGGAAVAAPARCQDPTCHSLAYRQSGQIAPDSKEARNRARCARLVAGRLLVVTRSSHPLVNLPHLCYDRAARNFCEKGNGAMPRPSALGDYTIHTRLSVAPSRSVYLGQARADEQPVLLTLWQLPRPLTPAERVQVEMEGAALRDLRHLTIVPLLDVSLTDREIVVVRASLPGRSLQAHLAARAADLLPPEEVRALLVQVGAALHAAHEQGITHGALSPATVLLTAEGRAMVADFQLHSLLAVLGADADDSALRRRYLAPEQFEGESSPAADQYALGCLAYELVTGRVPFAGLARTTLAQLHRSAVPPPPRRLNPALAPKDEHAILTALAKAPADRYPTLQSFLAALAVPAEPPDPLPGGSGQADVPQPDSSPVAAHGHVPTQPGDEPRRDVWEPQPAGVARPRPRHRSAGARSGRVMGLLAVGALVLLLLGTVVLWSAGPFGRDGSALLRSSSTPGARTLVSPPAGGFPTPAAWLPPRWLATSQPALTPTPPPQPALSPTPAKGTVTPVFECIIRQGGTAYLARFGYVNATLAAVTIPVGGENSLNPASLNGSQPTSFAPGSAADAFQVSSAKASIAWSLDGTTATATFHGPHC